MADEKLAPDEDIDELLERKENETSALRKIVAYMLGGKISDEMTDGNNEHEKTTTNH